MRGPLKPTDVVTSTLVVDVVNDACVHLCHADGSTSTNVSFAVVTLAPYNLSHVVVDFGDGVMTTAAEGDRPDDAGPPPSWAASCYHHAAADGGQAAVLRHDYSELGNFTASAYTTVCNSTCGDAAALTVGSTTLFAASLGAIDVRRSSIRRINVTAWDVRLYISSRS